MNRRILMVGGDIYCDTIVCAHAKHLTRAFGYHCSALGLGGDLGHPGDRDLRVFERARPFPQHDGLRSGSTGDKLRMANYLARSYLPYSSSKVCLKPHHAAASLSLREKLYRRVLTQRYASELPALVGAHKLCQWHCMDPVRLVAMPLFPRECQIVLAVWGSDLMRTAGIEAYEVQLAACQRAARIVVYSLELREIFLSKFGRQFADKMRLAMIGSDMFDVIDRCKTPCSSWREQHDVAPEKRVVCLGNNAGPINNHLSILNAIGLLPPQQRRRLVAVVPMTYGATPEYLAEVRATAERAQVAYRLLTDEQTDDEVAQLRRCTDIMIHMPVSDAFSAAAAEVMYCGGILVTGAWLPYGLMRRRGAVYQEVEDFVDLPGMLTHVLDNLDDKKQQAAGNRDIMRPLKAWDQVITNWRDIYDELIEG